MTINQDRVRQLAYQIWESEGKPEGQEARHWEMARKLAESEQSETPSKPAPRARRVSKPKAAPDADVAKSDAEKPAVLKKPRAPRSTSKTPKV
ncbi:DUF2934 domain-containing protein [Halopseudomonas nanhaiensis]|uniref:DUF2934 domain-containing protein n=1 Tax=Halopseudomonas nanhaiensis TaxID=2830842 RepID=UPI001CBF6771|nr:DUF2934 domain-containing protein [Halopseudomonas nanhaiensis]UAW97742.1 DUF2934 domain-containing protein [Halopseudomonas nanhaiensis]